MMGERVLACGGREFSERDVVFRALDEVPGHIECLIEGGARGADRLARDWTDARQVQRLSFPADWNKHGRAAGMIRNQRMIDEGKPTVVVAFPGGRGTADMVNRARKAGIVIRHIVPTPPTATEEDR